MINIKQITHNVFFWVLHIGWILHNSAKRMISVEVCICLVKTINSKTPRVMKPNSISFFVQSKMFVHNFWNIFVIFLKAFSVVTGLKMNPSYFPFLSLFMTNYFTKSTCKTWPSAVLSTQKIPAVWKPQLDRHAIQNQSHGCVRQGRGCSFVGRAKINEVRFFFCLFFPAVSEIGEEKKQK